MLKLNHKGFFAGLVLLALLVFGLFFPAVVRATGIADEPVNVEDCGDFDDLTGECAKPPTLKLVEIWVIKGLYIVWALGGFIFLVGLIAIGFKWMTSGGDEQKLKDLKTQATYWAISIPIFFGGVPAINFVLKVFPINTGRACYQDLDQPAFQIVFPNACEATLPTVVKDGAKSEEDGLGLCCDYTGNGTDVHGCPAGQTCTDKSDNFSYCRSATGCK